MIHYLLLNDDGSVFQRGRCLGEEDIPQVPGKTAEVIEAADPRRPKPPPEPSYDRYRAMAYPAIGDQLDAIWKALDTGNLTGEVKAMADRIKAVKAKYPKGDTPL